ncbi:MAG: peptidase Ste24p, partial [Nocardioides sp.]|nr:peptidase Ste24p [Nocardioides sp.]
ERQTHPFAVVRAAELRRWVESGEYDTYLGGAYPTREEDPAAGVTDAAKEAAASYAEVFRTSQDAVGKLVHDVAGLLGSAKLWFDDAFRRAE